MLKALRAQLKALADPRVAEHAQRFFKTGPGQYGEGDIFLGIRVPVLRRVACGYREMDRGQSEERLQSSIHEHRQIALFVLAGLLLRCRLVLSRAVLYLFPICFHRACGADNVSMGSGLKRFKRVSYSVQAS